MKKRRPGEGDVFAVPLERGGYALGVLNRVVKRGRARCAYFFPTIHQSLPGGDQVPQLRPQDAMDIWRFGDPYLESGRWPVVARIADFSREAWPLPRFIRREPIRETCSLITYSEDDPLVKIGEERCSCSVTGYPEDSLYTATAVEQVLFIKLKIENSAVRVPYREGDVFSVPVDGGYTVAVLARVPERGDMLLGYFFSRLFPAVPKFSELPELDASSAAGKWRFTDLYLSRGEWPIIGHLASWDRKQWPVPHILKRDSIARRAWLVSYDDDLETILHEEECKEDIRGYDPIKVIRDPLSVQAELSRIIAKAK